MWICLSDTLSIVSQERDLEVEQGDDYFLDLNSTYCPSQHHSGKYAFIIIVADTSWKLYKGLINVKMYVMVKVETL